MTTWKPGDVAVHDAYGWVALFVEGDLAICDHAGSGGHWHTSDGWDIGGADYRPLVVIDPESAEDVKRLLGLIEKWSGRVPYTDMYEDGDMTDEDALSTALREFAAPTPPKPAEPQGLGAVVEDDRGRRFVRDWTSMSKWREDGSDNEWAYRDIAVVRVLSEGVTP